MSKEKAIEAVEKSEDYKNIMMALAAEAEVSQSETCSVTRHIYKESA